MGALEPIKGPQIPLGAKTPTDQLGFVLNNGNRRTKWAWAIMVVLFLVHCLGLAKLFGGISVLFSPEPLIYQDHGVHFYYSLIGSRFLLEHGSSWGYDPYLMAGYPTDLFDTSGRLLKVAIMPMRMVQPEIAYKIIVFLLGAMIPLLLFLSGYWFGLPPEVIISSSLLGTLAWWLGGGLSIFIAGLVTFSFGSVYGISFTALFYRYLKKPSLGLAFLILFGAPLGLLIHPLLPVVAVFPCGVFYLLYFRKLSVRRHFFVFFAVFFALLANLFWLIPYSWNLAFAIPQPRHTNPLDLVSLLLFSTGHKVYLLALSLFLAGTMMILAVMGFRIFWKEARRDLVLGLGIGGLGLFCVFLFAGLVSILGNLEPIRYGLPFLLLITFPSAHALEHWVRSIRAPASSKFIRIPFLIILGICIFLALIFIFVSFLGVFKTPLVGMKSRVSVVRDWIITNTDPSARILLEGQNPFFDIYGSFPSGVLAYYTHRELIGGPYIVPYYKNQFADLCGVTLFGKFILQWDEKSLGEYMDYYNIGWVGVYSLFIKKLFDQYPNLFQPMGTAEGFQFYKVNRRHSFFLEGEGIAEADYNRIVLKNVRTSTGRVVIGYHWHPRLQVNLPAKISRVMIGRDPVGFIGIENPMPEMIIETKYWGKISRD